MRQETSPWHAVRGPTACSPRNNALVLARSGTFRLDRSASCISWISLLYVGLTPRRSPRSQTATSRIDTDSENCLQFFYAPEREFFYRLGLSLRLEPNRCRVDPSYRRFRFGGGVGSGSLCGRRA